jgi:predicted CopG family antitoxin
MGTKKIAISDEAYKTLKSLKKPGESFTDLIQRIARRSAVLDLAGIISKAQTTDTEKRVKRIRRQSSQRLRRTYT